MIRSGYLIYYSCKTQFENAGDLLINKLLISELRKYGQIIINNKKIPTWFSDELELLKSEYASNKKNPSLLDTIINLMITFNFLTKKRKVYFVLAPGHFFSGEKQQSIIRRVLRIAGYYCLKFLNVKICRFGSSLGPFSNLDLLTNKLISKSMLINYIREEYSYQYAVKNKISNIKRSPDLAFLLEEKKMFPATEFDTYKKYIIISFREGVIKTQLRHRFLDDAINVIVKYFTEIKKIQVVFTYQVELDKKYMEFLSDKYKKITNVYFINSRLHLQETFAIYGNAEFVFSNRLHVLLIAMSQNVIGVPIIDRKSHVKISGIYESMKKDNLIIDLDCFKNVDEIIKITQLKKNDNSIKQIFQYNNNLLKKDISSIF